MVGGPMRRNEKRPRRETFVTGMPKYCSNILRVRRRGCPSRDPSRKARGDPLTTCPQGRSIPSIPGIRMNQNGDRTQNT
eukprot:795798-Prorocentrum_minimum.AAC.1